MVGMDTKGMDVAAVIALANELKDAGDEIRTLGSALTSQLEGTFWEGDDATAFRSGWDGELIPLLHQIAASVTGLGVEAESQAAQQAATSAN
jgi:uncharacterized protein YukE